MAQIFKVALTRPWIILFDPISFLVALYISVTYTLLYMLFTIYPIVFRERRGWNAGVSELPLIGTVIGAAIGALIVFLDSRSKARRIEKGEELQPEDRLPLAMGGGVGFAITMFWFGWTANFDSVHWTVPTIAGVFLATSIVLIFVAFLNYLADSYLMFAASAIAANTVARSAAGASAPLFTNQMFTALGVGGGASLVGGVATLLAVVPFAFYKYGKTIRKRSRFAPTEPKPDEENQEHEKSQNNDESQETSSSDNSTIRRMSSSSTIEEDSERSGHQANKSAHNDVQQNSLGEPRIENVNFGHEKTGI